MKFFSWLMDVMLAIVILIFVIPFIIIFFPIIIIFAVIMIALVLVAALFSHVSVTIEKGDDEEDEDN